MLIVCGYLVVGAELYGTIFVHEKKVHGKCVLAMDKHSQRV